MYCITPWRGIESSSVQEHTCVTDAVELNSVALTLNSRLTVHIIGVYRPPAQSINEFNIALGNIAASIPRSKLVYIVGDMNIDLLVPGDLMEEYCATLQSVSYLPGITEPTRVTTNSISLIDHIWTIQLHPR